MPTPIAYYEICIVCPVAPYIKVAHDILFLFRGMSKDRH